MIASNSSTRALLHRVIFAAVVVTLCPLLTLGLERSDGVADDLASLVRQK